MSQDSKLIPILREGIEIVKAIFFKELRACLQQRHGEWPAATLRSLTAAVTNDVFGVPDPSPAPTGMPEYDQSDFQQAHTLLLTELASLRIPVTDALRTLVLCDYQEGRDSSYLLQRAQTYGILIPERDLPLPHHFIDLVRRLGVAHGLLQPLPPGPEN